MLRSPDLRHRDVVTLALRRLQRDVGSRRRSELLREARAIVRLDRDRHGQPRHPELEAGDELPEPDDVSGSDDA